MWNPGFLLLALGYGPGLLYFAAKMVPMLTSSVGFFVVVLKRPILWTFVCFGELPYFLALGDPPGSSCVFPAPVLESSFSPRSLGFFY